MNTHPLVGKNPSGREIRDLNYAIGYGDDDELLFIIIERDLMRHPVSNMHIKENMISWLNNKGVIETLGLEYPLPDAAIQMAATSELFISEMNGKKKDIGEFVFTVRPERLVSSDVELVF